MASSTTRTPSTFRTNPNRAHPLKLAASRGAVSIASTVGILCALLSGCGDGTEQDDDALEPETGGTTGTGGASASGGTTGSGGATNSGGAQGSGAAQGSGGTSGSGGAPGTGGVAGSGGATGAGGADAAGGADGTGGADPDGGDGPCVDGKWTTTDVTKMGPFETVEENVSGAVLYRPEEMLNGCLYPTITWGHGAGGQPSNYTAVLHIMASHGFVVIASTAGNVQDGGNAGNQFRNGMVQVAEWVVEQNSNPSSPLFEKMDPDKIGASGHSQGGYGASEAGQNPLITTSVSISGAVGSSNQNGPAFIICGGQDPFSGARCEDHPSASFNGTSGVPVFFGTALDADHGNWGFGMPLSENTQPHDITSATIAWFRYYLMGDEAYRSWFFGGDCHLCNHSNWSVQRKGFD